MIEFIIASSNNEIILSNIKDISSIKQLLKCSKETENIVCEITNKNKKRGKLMMDKFNLFLSSDDTTITNKIFKHYCSFYKIIADEIIINLEATRGKESQKTRRLKHNLINHNAGILQELYRVFSQEQFKNGNNHLDVIQGVIKNDSRKAAYAFLRVLKNSNLMKAEFDVYEMLDQENPLLNFTEHPIHKVVMLTLNPFWLDLIEKNVNIIIQPFFEKISIDYKTISVAFSHIFDNATKYILPDSTFKINFEDTASSIIISFDMVSLKIYPEEIVDIFRENVSGQLANAMGKCGDGIGMFITKRLIELNNGDIKLHLNVNPYLARMHSGLPYENNIIEIIIDKDDYK